MEMREARLRNPTPIMAIWRVTALQQQQNHHWSFVFFKFTALLLANALKPKDIARFNAREMTATYNGPNGVPKTDDVSSPKLFVYSSIRIPENTPTSSPA